MSYAKSQNEYDGIYRQFINTAPQSVKTYFEQNWHGIKEEWVMGFKFSIGNFLNNTNNRLESINGKLKQVVSKFSSLEFFIEQFFVILPVLRNERSYKAVYSYQKTPVVPYDVNSPEGAYTSFLTKYASSFVLHQLQLFSNTTYAFTPDVMNPDTYHTTTSEGATTVSSLKCTCCFFQSMRLPCRHIFHVRHNLGVTLFEKRLCDERWTSSYFKSKHKLLHTTDDTTQEHIDDNTDGCTVEVSTQERIKRWTSQQKYSRAMDVCKKIANTISLCSQENFDRKLQQLISLNEAWTNGNEIGFQTFENMTDSGTGNIDLSPSSVTRGENVPTDFTVAPAFDESQDFDIDIGWNECDGNNRGNIIDEDVVSSIVNVISGEYLPEESVEDILFGFNMNHTSHIIDSEVKICLKFLIDQVIQEEIESQNVIGDQSIAITKIKTIKMPPAIKRKGRPKGSDKTNVIGTTKTSKKKLPCERFIEMRQADKEEFVLSLCIGKEHCKKALYKYKYSGTRLEIDDLNPTEIGCAVFNSSIILSSIRYLFTDEAWERFESFYNDKSQYLKFMCNFCYRVDANGDDLIACEHCLNSFHFLCVKLKKNVKKRQPWFCNPCKTQEKLRKEVSGNAVEDCDMEEED